RQAQSEQTSRAEATRICSTLRTESCMTIFRGLVQKASKPEAFQNAFQPLLPDQRCKHCNGVSLMDGKVNGRRSPRKESQESRHVHYVMAHGGNRVLCEVGGQISTRWRIKLEVALRAFIDRSSYQPTLLFCRHREHEDRIGELLPRHVSQLS